MGFLFLGLVASILGANVEGYARSNPALRPAPPVGAIWYFMGKATAIGHVAAFIGSFFVLPWWAVLLEFFGAFVVQLLFLDWARKLDAAPGISMLLMVVGAVLIVFGLLNPEQATF